MNKFYCLSTRTPQHIIQAALIILACLLPNQYAAAQDTSCLQGSPLQHTFESGASWTLCATVSDTHGLSIANVYFRAPGDTSRSVLEKAHVGQILLHYHDKAKAEPQISPTGGSNTARLSSTLQLTASSCSGEILTVNAKTNTVCSSVENNRTLAKYAQRPSLQSEAWELSSIMLRESITWNISWTFTEDGQIRPVVSASGRASRIQLDSQFSQNERFDIPRLTRATILSTWRLIPALDTDSIDSIEQFDFPLNVSDKNRRPMRTTHITEETFMKVDRENFRGWRILDASGAGYYLDPANQGYNYSSTEHEWASYEIAFTRFSECEQYATQNQAIDAECGQNLTDFVNTESLAESKPVIWYSQSRLLNPTIEDWPVLSDIRIEFDLLPFDWTDTSPFETLE